MSSRGKNHTRGTMQAWRGMAAEGYPGKAGTRDVWFTKPHPRVLRRNSRWRPIVRLLAKQAGWSIADEYIYTAFGGPSMGGFMPWGSVTW